MDHQQDQGMMMTSPPPSSSMGMMPNHKMMMTHMTFYWGNNSEILFSGWPGTRPGMYFLALIVVFVVAVFIEWLAGSRLVKRKGDGVISCIRRTVVHAIRMGLAYLLMLAVMSFNVGVLIAVILGHALGYLIFGSGHKGSDDPSFPH